jgi:tetratricopeptide (TPR) repeat protein
MIGTNAPLGLPGAKNASRLTMWCRHIRESPLRGAGIAGMALVLGAIATANAQQYQSQSQQRPAYGQAPSYRTVPNSQPSYQSTTTPPQAQRTTQPAQPTQSAPAQTAAQPAPSEPPRRPQPLASSAASAQAATACMNEQKSASVDTTIKGCDAVIGETLKNLANAYYFRGSAKFGKSDFDGAIGDYGQALRLDPADPDYLTSRAAAYEAKKDMDRALADYNEAIKSNPNSIYAYNNRGAAYQRKGDFARAAADYGEVTRLQPNNLDAWSARCWVRAISPNQAPQALSDCNAALKIKADAADVLDTRGFVYLKLGQTDNAIKDFDAALKADPKLAGSLYGRGIAKTRKGDRNGAGTDFAAAKAIKPDIAEEFARYGLRP